MKNDKQVTVLKDTKITLFNCRSIFCLSLTWFWLLKNLKSEINKSVIHDYRISLLYIMLDFEHRCTFCIILFYLFRWPFSMPVLSNNGRENPKFTSRNILSVKHDLIGFVLASVQSKMILWTWLDTDLAKYQQALYRLWSNLGTVMTNVYRISPKN